MARGDAANKAQVWGRTAASAYSAMLGREWNDEATGVCSLALTLTSGRERPRAVISVAGDEEHAAYAPREACIYPAPMTSRAAR
ncbi:hypothetical protein A9Q02_19930 [Candidatus Chloroploca asiatica]|uniref:Uncharacterized protein n=1 Tax=Candidatus Chloroploca asiatica TaxID=1506545 RepID=A0A2H3KGQ6_9CHLR|nr:hypothetical protein A9Q02_19930 [Candidatus Chloroploca asiatica]